MHAVIIVYKNTQLTFISQKLLAKIVKAPTVSLQQL